MAQNVVGAFNVRAGLDSTQFRTGCKDVNNAISQSATAVASSATKLMTPLKGVNKHIEDSRRTFRSFQRDAKQVFESTRTSSERYAAQVAKLSNLHKRGFLDAQTYARGLKQARGSMTGARPGMGAQLGGMGRGLGMAAGLPLGPIALGAAAIAGVGKAAKTAEGFTQAMNQSLAITSDVSGKMRAEMERTAFSVARSTKFSAAEAAESYFYLFSAGMDVQQSLAALPQVAKFAQAGMFDLARATDLATDAQSALGMVAKDPTKNLQNLTKITDVLVGANTLANASTEQFSEAITNKLGAAARTIGMDLEEVVALLAVFADQGRKGQEAGTMGAIALRELQKAALKNAEAFEENNIAVFDGIGEFRKLADIVGDIETCLEGLSDAERKATLMQLGFNEKSIQAIEALLGTSDAMRQYDSDLRNMAGVTDTVANKQMTEFQQGWQELTAAMSKASSVMMEVPLEKLGAGFSKLATAISEMPSAFNAIGVSFAEMFGGGEALGKQLEKDIQRAAGLEVVGPAKHIGDVQEYVKMGGKAGLQEKGLWTGPENEEAAKNAGKDLGDALGEGIRESVEKTFTETFGEELERGMGGLGERFEDQVARFGKSAAELRELDIADMFREQAEAIKKSAAPLKEQQAAYTKLGETWRKATEQSEKLSRLQDASKLQKRGESLMEQFRTSEEKLQAFSEDMQRLVAAGAITGEVALQALQEQAKKLSPKAREIGAADWIERGTQAEAIREWEHRERRQADPIDQLRAVAEQQLAEAIRLREATEQLAEQQNAPPKVCSAPP